jgi:sugar/nucleoside kinase (ribokinase family)
MKKYDVYGIGNALLDMVYEVDDAILSALNIDKNLMTLIDEHEHHHIIEGLRQHKATYACGGSAANTIITAQELGAATYYACHVANDTAGNLFYHDLITKGVATNLTEHYRPAGTTGKCIVTVTPDAERSMSTYLGITSELDSQVINEQAVASSHYVYLEGYLVAADAARAAAVLTRDIAQQSQVKTSLTLSDANMVTGFKEGLHQILGNGVDLLFCNEQEALLFCDTEDFAIAKKRLLNYCKQYVITQGAHGACAYDGKQWHHIKPYSAKVIDTLGAGDTYAGAFLYAINHGFRFDDAARLANLAAARVVEKIGPRLDARELTQVRQTLSKTRTP